MRIARSGLGFLGTERFKTSLERLRFAAFVLGCASLFWQWDLAAADLFFALGILASFALWERGAPLLDLAWPQPLLLVFLAISAVVTTVEAGSLRFFGITAYLAVAALALTSALRRDPRRIGTIEAAMIVAGTITAVTVAAGAAATPLGVPFLHVFAYDYLRGEGLFKDPNVAGAFVACTYPLAVARSLRLQRRRLVFLVVATAVFAGGVVFSYSRWALILLVLGLVGTMIALAIARDRRPLVVLAVIAVVGGLVGQHTLPSFRYQAVQTYDETGRLLAWRLALELLQEHPLGIGSGAFEAVAVERYTSYATSDSTPTEKPPSEAPTTGSPATPNLVSNGAFDGATDWHLPTFAVTIDDPTSPTGHALRKTTSDVYQDPGISIPVQPGQAYSFGAAIRTDGTPALLIVHWRDASDVTISQANSDAVTSVTWTETQLSGQIAPADAKAAVLLLSNLEPGTQYFTAVRVVAGPVAPPWSADLQRIDRAGQSPAVQLDPGCRSTASCSTHNTFLRLVVESGVPGFLALCGYWLILAWGLLKMGRRSYPWSVAFLLVVLAGLTIDTLHWRQLWIYIAVAAASFVRSRAVATPRMVATGVRANAPIADG